MARSVVVYDRGDLVGHYDRGLGMVVEKETVGDLQVEIKFFDTGLTEFIEPYKVYLVKDVSGRSTGRTLRVYMTDKEIIDWAASCYKAGKFKSEVHSVKHLCNMLGCRTNSWHLVNTDFDKLSNRLQKLLDTVRCRDIVVAIRVTPKKTTIVVGEYQSRRNHKYGGGANTPK